MTLTSRHRERLEMLYVETMWRRAAADPDWFFTNLIQIPSQRDVRGREPLVPFDYQQDTLDAFRKYRYTVVLKARQLGLTTIATAYALWLLLFRPGTVVLLVSKNQDAANKALHLIRFMWQFLPEWTGTRRPELVTDAATQMTWRFEDGLESRIKSLAATKTAGAGETATLVLWDETALAPDQADTLRTLLPTTDAGGSMILFSTARGAHNTFAQTFRAAQRGESRWHPVFHPWTASRLIDADDYEAKKAEFAAEPWLFYAEYPSDPEEAFRESGRPRFADLPDLADLTDLPWRGHIADNGDLIADPEGPLRLTLEGVKPDPWRQYVLAVDPATGQGLDYTAGHVYTWTDDGRPWIVGYWHANDIEPVVASAHMDRLGRHFHRALLVVEKSGGWGDTYINELHLRLGYPNLYLHRITGHRKRKASTTFGFPMHWTKRPLVIDRLAEMLPDLEGIHPALRLELGTFVRRPDGKVAADVGCHDDLVMSAALGLYVLTESTGATTRPKGEKPGDPMAVYNLAAMKAEIEKAIVNDELNRARQDRRAQAAYRRRQRTAR